MSDHAQVMRLRKLRETALQARALAAVLESRCDGRSSIFSRSAQCCWRIARIATGTLRGHPYRPFQRGVAPMRSLVIGLSARLEGRAAWRRGAGVQKLDAHLRWVARQLGDARALTWDQNLGEAFGRLQIQLARLMDEAGAGARLEARLEGHAVTATLQPTSLRPAVAVRAVAVRSAVARPPVVGASALADHWPYLAI